jgi:uncharacterized surface protein with fasciclin (FAS1) repeats
MFRKLLVAPVAALTLVVGAALPAGAHSHPSRPTIAQIVGSSGGTFDHNGRDFDMLLNAVKAAGLVDALNAPGALTVLAPNDDAFVKLARDLGYHGRDEAGAFDAIVGALTTLGNGDPIPVLTNVLLYHVVPERIGAYRISQRHALTTLLGVNIGVDGFRLKDKEPQLRDPRMIVPGANIRASNGLVHTVNRVLIPVDLP